INRRRTAAGGCIPSAAEHRTTAHTVGGGAARGDLRQVGSSMLTLVALMAATAMTPGARPSWSAASRLMRETTRNGPATISTWAITLSLVTLVTIPVSRLRALWT